MNARQALTVARSQLVLRHPFFGMLALRLRLVERTDLPFKTMAVDGTNLYYDPDFVTRCSRARLMAAVGHEVLHCALAHISRRGAREPLRWNMAIDYAANLILADAGLDVDREKWLYNEKFKNMPAEEIYNLLPPQQSDDGGGNGGSGGQGVFDDHMPVSGTSEEEQAQAHSWKTATVQAAQAAAARGKLPGTLQRLVDEMLEPQVDWREKLAKFMHAGKGYQNYNWMTPQRRMLVHGLVLPAMDGKQMGTIVAVSDDSGSISAKELQALASEINGISISTQPERLIHISCDAAVNHVAEFSPTDTFVMESKGGGGTDFRPPFDYVEKHDIAPQCLIYLTDGYGPFPPEPPAYPVLWVMTTDVVPPWGEYVRIEL